MRKLYYIYSSTSDGILTLFWNDGFASVEEAEKHLDEMFDFHDEVLRKMRFTILKCYRL